MGTAQTPNMYRFLLLAAALCAAASAFPAEQPMDMVMGVTGLWNAFKIDFNKVYSPEEEAHRLVAFKDNVETIYRHNAQQAPTHAGPWVSTSTPTCPPMSSAPCKATALETNPRASLSTSTRRTSLPLWTGPPRVLSTQSRTKANAGPAGPSGQLPVSKVSMRSRTRSSSASQSSSS